MDTITQYFSEMSKQSMTAVLTYEGKMLLGSNEPFWD